MTHNVFGGTVNLTQSSVMTSMVWKWHVFFVTVIARHMRWGRQEDAHEFLRYVVDALQRSALVGLSKYVIDYASVMLCTDTDTRAI